VEALTEYEQAKANKQLESWNRYVWSKVLLRRLELTGVNVESYFNFLVGKHYTLTEKEFQEIKELYANKKRE
jgi:hypothetical protein